VFLAEYQLAVGKFEHDKLNWNKSEWLSKRDTKGLWMMRHLGFISTFDKQVFAFGSIAKMVAGSTNEMFDNFYKVEHVNGRGMRLISEGNLRLNFMLVTEMNELYIISSSSVRHMKLPTTSQITQVGFCTHGIVATGTCHTGLVCAYYH
jgi:hypothetical protein